MIISFNKRFCLSIIVSGILLISCVSTKGKTSSIPLWADSQTLNQIFPKNDYIAFIGYGETEESALLKAETEVASYFNHEISVQTLATESIENKSGVTNSERFVKREINVSSNTELIALRHTDAYFDAERKRYAVCAYISRQEAWQFIEPELNIEKSEINDLYSRNKNERELFYKIIFLNEIQKHIEKFNDLYYQTIVFAPDKISAFSETEVLLQATKAEAQKLKREAGVNIKIQGDSSGRIKTKLNEVFGAEGFLLSTKSSKYNVVVTVKNDVQDNEEIFTSYPQIDVSIENSNGKVITSWSKQINKISAYNRNTCERMALSKIENELETAFKKEVFYSWSAL